jgi:site-specific DNA-methyltransferase (adenine-specific)
MDMDRIYQADSFKKTCEIDDESIDLIVTSPPYADRRKDTYEGIAPEKYVEWFLPLSEQLFKKLKPTGSFILNIKENVIDGERLTYVFELVMALRQQGWLWTETYMWYKKNATPGKWPNRFRDAFEYCFHFTKQRKFTMFQDAVKVPIGGWAEKRMKSLSANDRKRSSSATGSGFGRNVSNWAGKESVFPDNVVVSDDRRVALLATILEQGANQPSSTLAETILAALDEAETSVDSNVVHLAAVCNDRQHSAAFPEKLPEFFIKLFTAEHDLVFDPFLGSGTTAKAAKDLKRKFLGFELKQEYFEAARSRLELVAGTVMFADAEDVEQTQEGNSP